MNYLLYITLMGLLSGIIGTGSGGLSTILMNKFWDDILGVLLGFSAGVMTIVIFMDLVPSALESGSLVSTFLGIFLGAALIALIDIKFPHQHFSLITETPRKDRHYFKTGILLSIGIALHNIPEGIAIGASFISSRSAGMALAVLIALHNLPEGMAVATALGLAKLKNSSILIITLLTGVPMGIGAFIGGFFGGISSWFLSVALGFAGGAMLYIVYDELIPDSHRKTTGHTAIAGIVAGVLFGIVLIELLHH
ncbi:MAG: ZIP family metal transporter [Halanaerobiales bacterium]